MIDETYERDKLKYSDLCHSMRKKGCSVLCYYIHIECCGSMIHLFDLSLRTSCVTEKEIRKA